MRCSVIERSPPQTGKSSQEISSLASSGNSLSYNLLLLEQISLFLTMLTQTQTTLTDASANLVQLCEQVIADCAARTLRDRDVVIISRPDGENVALIAADELSSLMETVHLLRSPKNAARLLTALERVKARTEKPQTVSELRKELEIGSEER